MTDPDPKLPRFPLRRYFFTADFLALERGNQHARCKCNCPKCPRLEKCYQYGRFSFILTVYKDSGEPLQRRQQILRPGMIVEATIYTR
jgi:hypothetical protein